MVGELKQRIRDTMIKLNGRSEPGDIYTMVRHESLPFFKESGTSLSKLPEVLKEELMLIGKEAEQAGDRQLKDLTDMMLEENTHFQRLGNKDYADTCIRSELSKKGREHGPEAMESMMKDVSTLPKTEEEMRDFVFDKFRDHCATNQFMQNHVYKPTMITGGMEPEEMAAALRREKLAIRHVDAILYDATVDVDGVKRTERMKIVYFDPIEGVDIEVSESRTGHAIIREMMRVFCFPATVTFKEKHEPHRLSAHFCLGFNDDEIAASVHSLASNSVNMLTGLENCKWTLDDFKTAD